MIELAVVSKSFGPVAAVRELSLKVGTAATTALVGPSGAGKTTVLRLVAGLELPDAGTVSLAGLEVSRPGWGEAPHRRGIGFVFQSPALWPHLSVRANVVFALAGRGHGRAAARRQADATLDRVGAIHLAERRPDQLSGGEARRVALARALAPRPRILLLDEPLTNLDPTARHELAALISEVAGESRATVLVVTHQADEVALLGADRVDLAPAVR